MGQTYRGLWQVFARGAEKVLLTEPYLGQLKEVGGREQPHQIANLRDFIFFLHEMGSVRELAVLTRPAALERVMAADLATQAARLGIQLTFPAPLDLVHDRRLVFVHAEGSWTVRQGHGLHFHQPHQAGLPAGMRRCKRQRSATIAAVCMAV